MEMVLHDFIDLHQSQMHVFQKNSAITGKMHLYTSLYFIFCFVLAFLLLRFSLFFCGASIAVSVDQSVDHRKSQIERPFGCC